MTRWLIDGMNVIGSRPDGWWRDRGKAQRQLVDELGRFAAAKRERVTVVFDGRKQPIDPQPGVEVHFATTRGRNAADHDIAELAKADADPSELAVVTSDADLVDRVEQAGARTVGAGGFRRLLDA